MPGSTSPSYTPQLQVRDRVSGVNVRFCVRAKVRGRVTVGVTVTKKNSCKRNRALMHLPTHSLTH